MRRQFRVLSAAALAGLAGFLASAPAAAQAPVSHPKPESTNARANRTTVSGVVSDESGSPVHGAMVTAIGATMALVTTDQRGRFSFPDLPRGEYVVRASLTGFAASRREIVRVGETVSGIPRLELRRLGSASATGPVDPTLKGRTILTAGFEGSPPESVDPAAPPPSATKGDHPHNETAWRLRHIKRSILKDSAREVVVNAENDLSRGSIFGRAFGSAGNLAASLLTDVRFSGEVNLLTTSAVEPGEFISGGALPRGVAYLSLGAPTPAGDWLVKAAMSEGDLASWILAGSFVSKQRPTHSYTLGLSYSTQEYQGGNPAALAAVANNSRNVGEVYAFGTWKVSPAVALDFGGRYARFDYLENRGLLSPRVGVVVEPIKGTRIISTAAQRMVAPGAEEFLPPRTGGPWLPPERTFSPLGAGQLRGERTRYIDIGLEQEFSDSVLGVRRFFQSVDDQLATLFGISPADGARAVGHYYVTNVGAVDADGWGVRLSSRQSARVHAVIDYTLTRANWLARGELPSAANVAPSVIRAEREDIHDVTTTLQTEIPETATRVFVLYKVNSAFTRHGAPSSPGLDGRFDVQINQSLPFGLGGTEWEVLFGLRNLFRDPTDPGSVYDELLVVRPPKRVVGGFLVRF
jgi:Carboxypeptidase regulatory-like domain/TonB dependent receptor